MLDPQLKNALLLNLASGNAFVCNPIIKIFCQTLQLVEILYQSYLGHYFWKKTLQNLLDNSMLDKYI